MKQLVINIPEEFAERVLKACDRLGSISPESLALFSLAEWVTELEGGKTTLEFELAAIKERLGRKKYHAFDLHILESLRLKRAEIMTPEEFEREIEELARLGSDSDWTTWDGESNTLKKI